MTKTIVVLGGNFTGIPVAHYLLKHTSHEVGGLKVIIVSPNTHLYWHNASIRAIVPDMLPDDKVFIPIAPAFAKYPRSQFEHVLGKAQRLDPSINSVHIVTNDGASRTIKYDAVVIATGSDLKEDIPLKTLSSTEETKEKLQAYRKRIASAKSIVVAGAGFTGVELAGELGTEYGTTKEIIFIADKDLPLDDRYLKDVREVVRKDLGKLGVKIISNAKVRSVSPAGAEAPVTIEVSKTDGTKETLKADVFLPTFGVIPNTQFVPPDMLDRNGFVKQTTHLRAEGHDNVFVVGDAGSLEASQGKMADQQTVHIVKVIGAYLGGEKLPKYQPETRVMVGISLGKGKGTGQVGNWRLWGFLITWVKSRTLFVDYAPALVAGTRTFSVKNWA